MAINVDFYTFNKKPNSTAQPTGTATTFPCNLIEPSSVIAPDIALTVAGNPTVYNYARIAEFSRYYFVTDWTYSGGRWVASLSVDVLASFKSYIGSQTQYVLRSSARSDGNIIDTLYPTKNLVTRDFSGCTSLESGISGNPFVDNLSEGIYIVGVINGDNNAMGCVSYYEFTNSQFRSLCSALFNSTDWMYNGIEEIGLELTKLLFNPFQYIASCIWIPEKYPNGTLSSVKYGWWDLGVEAYRITGNLRTDTLVFEIPKHPQNARGAYLNGSPFSRYFLDWPCFGRIALDANILKDQDQLFVNYYIDPITGIGTMRAILNAVPYYTQQTQIGVPIQLAQMATDYLGFAQNIASVASNIKDFDIGGLFRSIGNAVQSAIPQMTTTGKNGSYSSYKFAPELCAEFYNVVDDDNEHLGRPLCMDVAPNTIPGYMLCTNVEVEIPCTHMESEKIVETMEAGFYYE